jgi:hypothetical protein
MIFPPFDYAALPFDRFWFYSAPLRAVFDRKRKSLIVSA